MSKKSSPEIILQDLFYIPHGDHHLIYMPLRGVLFSANRAFIHQLSRAQAGDPKAIKLLQADGKLAGLFADESNHTGAFRRLRQSPFKPVSLSLFLTGDCTLRCRYCYASGGERKTRMSWKLFTGAVSEIARNALENGTPQLTVHFHGGGDVGAAWDLLEEGWQHLSQTAQTHGLTLRTTLGSNGYLDRGQCDWVIRHIDSATISIDGTPEIQNAQRPTVDGGDSFPRLDAALKCFDAAGFNYSLRGTVTAQSVDRLPESVEFLCRAYAAHFIKMEPMYPRGRGAKGACRPPDPERFIGKFRIAREIARHSGRELIYSGARLDAVTHQFCQAAGQSCAITPEGWVTSCYEVLSPGDPLAGIFFYGRFDIERGRFVIDERKRKRLFSLNVLHKPFCARCFCKWHCAGDCPAKSLHDASSSRKTLPDRCRITQELTKDLLLELLTGETCAKS